MAKDDRVRWGTFADLRGILSGKVVRPPTDEELRQWIDEARSRNMPESLNKLARNSTKIQDRQN